MIGASSASALSLAETAFSIDEALESAIFQSSAPSFSAVQLQSSEQLGRCPCCSHYLFGEGFHLPRARIGVLTLIFSYSSLCTFRLIKWLSFRVPYV